MTYGDQGYRFRGDGFRDEPSFRGADPSTSSYGTGRYAGDDYGTASPTGDRPTGPVGRHTVSAAELDDVFDDPEHGEPGMDRMAVHVVWEIVLLVAVGAMAVWFQHSHRAGVSGAGLRDLLLTAASLGFITLGLGLSLRAGAVNLAVGPVSVASGLFLATHSDRGLVETVGIAVLMSIGVGLVIAVLVAAFQVPGWAASLAAALAVVVWIQKHIGLAPVTTTYHADRDAFYWYGAFAALALLGGILGLVKPIRRGVGRFRPVGDPAARRGVGGAAMVFVALVGASAFASVGGLLAALSAGSVAPVDGFGTTGLALGAALGAGTSAFGRRGGVLGTLLSVTLLTLIIKYGTAANLRMSPYAVAAAAVAVGLLVTRLVEAFGRPRAGQDPMADEEEWEEEVPAAGSRATEGTSAWSSTPRQGGWTSQLPARSTDDTWGGAADDRWGVR